jgi:hypothetical protein
VQLILLHALEVQVQPVTAAVKAYCKASISRLLAVNLGLSSDSLILIEVLLEANEDLPNILSRSQVG